ncbi:hypothetical protein [Haloferula sp. A504]|uniref:hypothetical protein n=1 Tax=Haloferula sp. A504 TaxID=3373601 RepID=UPI0031BCB529|nr:hypothetical protein [Verrucomicrobiaceae bacterium E54]
MANNSHTQRKYPPVADRVEQFQAAWQELAPEETFAGMTLAEFDTAVAPVRAHELEMKALAAQKSAAVKRRKTLDTEARKVLRKVANAVRAHLSYGEDSELYRAMGYVTLSERRSGLVRQGAQEGDEPTEAESPAAGEAA